MLTFPYPFKDLLLLHAELARAVVRVRPRTREGGAPMGLQFRAERPGSLQQQHEIS